MGPWGGASLTALGWATANRGVLGGAIKVPSKGLFVVLIKCNCKELKLIGNCKKLWKAILCKRCVEQG